MGIRCSHSDSSHAAVHFLQQTAKSRPVCADLQAHMGICCSHAAVHFFPQTTVKISQRGCIGSYGYSLPSCDVLFLTDSESQIRLLGYAGSYGYSLFTCGVSTCLVSLCDGMTKWSGNIQLSMMRRRFWQAKQP